ncbi:MAG: C4-type zinc ribbon domain-containing protein [Pseudomonadota bacterium]
MATFSEQLDLLSKVQKRDTQIRDLQAALAAVPGRCALLSQRLETQTADLALRRSQRDALKKIYRERENQVKELAVLVKRSNARLHEVKTNKEYESVLKEIDDVKGHMSQIEDIMIADLDAMDLADESVAAAETALTEAKAEIEAEISTVTARAENDRRLLADLEKEVAALSADIANDLKAKYRLVRQQKPDGVAVCEVIDAICQGCKLSIPQQLYNDLQRRNELKLCPKCARIIFWHKRIQ